MWLWLLWFADKFATKNDNDNEPFLLFHIIETYRLNLFFLYIAKHDLISRILGGLEPFRDNRKSLHIWRYHWSHQPLCDRGQTSRFCICTTKGNSGQLWVEISHQVWSEGERNVKNVLEQTLNRIWDESFSLPSANYFKQTPHFRL